MASRTELEQRVADCRDVAACIDLAREAMATPADAALAKELLSRGELLCQLPADYAKLADAAVELLSERGYAAQLYEQAEEACFEPAEYALVGYGIARTLGERERGTALIRAAAADATDPAALLDLWARAREVMPDDALTGELAARVDASCETLADVHALAARLVGSGAAGHTAARALYEGAARFCVEAADGVAYARGVSALFQDDEWARRVLEEAEAGCQFTAQFVTVAGAWHELFQDAAKVDELLAQGEEFSMTGEEHAALAGARWELQGDGAAAVAAYRRALAECSGNGELLELARAVAGGPADAALLGDIYAKLEPKLATARELVAAAREAHTQTPVAGIAAGLLARAGERFAAAEDIAMLADGALALLGKGDVASGLLRAALDRAGGFQACVKAGRMALEQLNDTVLAQAALERAAQLASSSTDLLALARFGHALGRDEGFVTAALAGAEDAAAGVDDLRAVVQELETLVAPDDERLRRARERLERREANEVRYAEFQKLESGLRTLREHLELSERVRVELDDTDYVRRLLDRALELLDAEAFDPDRWRALVLGADRMLRDAAWLEQLYARVDARCGPLAWRRVLARTAARDLADHEAGRALARSLYESGERAIAETAGAAPWLRLAAAVQEDLDDDVWCARLLEQAQDQAPDATLLTEMALLWLRLGEEPRARGILLEAARGCGGVEHCVALAARLREAGIARELLHDVYAAGGEALSEPLQRLRWAEGIADVLGDGEWSARAFDEIAASCGPGEARRYACSRDARLGRRLY